MVSVLLQVVRSQTATWYNHKHSEVLLCSCAKKVE
jgi:hypothetical protein